MSQKMREDYGYILCTKDVINKHGIKNFTKGKKYEVECIGVVDMAFELVVLEDHNMVSTFVLGWSNPDQDLFKEHFEWWGINEETGKLEKETAI
jgi:hypothetical protein